MAKLYFRYGAMGSSKSANALMVKHNYEERGQSVLLVKPEMDQRDGEKIIYSRCGLSSPCEYFDVLWQRTVEQYQCIIVDEAQFLTKDEVMRLTEIVDVHHVPVIAYGLRADFRGELFEGSAALLAHADSIEEVKTICWCGKKALYNTRIQNGKVVKTGKQIMLGADDLYIGLCRRHWKNGALSPEQDEERGANE